MKISEQPTRDQVLYLLKTRGQMTVKELSRALDITPMGVRQHLDILTRDGLVAYEWLRKGRGRPSQVFSLTERGHNRFPRSYARLALSLLEDIEAAAGRAVLDKAFARRTDKLVGEYEARMTASNLADRVEALARIRDEEGYLTEWEQVNDDTFVLIQNNCPVCDVARAHPYPCQSEMQLFRRLLADARVQRDEHIVNGSRRCRYVITRLG